MHAGLGFNRPTSIFISHLHGDHLLGLPGLLQTMSSLVRDKPLELFGPKGLSGFLSSLRTTLGFQSAFPLRIIELSPGASVKKPGYQIRTILAKHDIICLAYGLFEDVRPGHFHPNVARRLGVPEGPLWKELQNGKTVNWEGRKILPEQVTGPPRAGLKLVYAIDTRPADSVKRLAHCCDLLIHDGGFTLDRKDKAREYYHSTAVEAASVAKASKSKKLALVHISAVTRDDSILLREARKVFRNTLVPRDLTVLSLKRTP